MMQKNKFLLVFVIIFYFIAILGNIIDQYVSFLSWADELSAILLFVLYINKAFITNWTPLKKGGVLTFLLNTYLFTNYHYLLTCLF